MKYNKNRNKYIIPKNLYLFHFEEKRSKSRPVNQMGSKRILFGKIWFQINSGKDAKYDDPPA